VDDLGPLLLEATPDRATHEALADLADLPASAGLGLAAARGLQALHRHARSRRALQATVHDAPPPLALQALTMLWSSAEPTLATEALPGSRLGAEAPALALARLSREPPGGLARTSSATTALGPAARWAASLTGTASPELEEATLDALLTWQHELAPELAQALRSRLTPPAQDLLGWLSRSQEPETAAALWVARRPARPVLRMALDLAVGRSWQTWGRHLAAAIATLETDVGMRAAAYRTMARLAQRRGDGDGVILGGLRALEVDPEDGETLDLLVDHLEVRPGHRRILQAWAAHVENDPRFALALRTLWADTGRARRALGPLLRARRARPRDAAVAAATGRLMLDQGRDEEALTHLLAAARLGHFAHDPAYGAPLALALARTGHPDRARKLYRHWLRRDEDGTIREELESLGSALGGPDVARLPRRRLPGGDRGD
jgi:tetratricopeptide (TPR) repeat protein